MGGPAARGHEKRSGRRQRLLQYVVIVISPLARRETLHWRTAVTDRLWREEVGRAAPHDHRGNAVEGRRADWSETRPTCSNGVGGGAGGDRRCSHDRNDRVIRGTTEKSAAGP